jgi:FAD/FMN-containing dehydrogenase
MTMIDACRVTGEKIQLDEAAVNGLRTKLRGPLLGPTSDGYGESCLIWNGMIKSKPALVVRATGTADVIEAIRFARKEKLCVAPKCGGHNIAGTALADAGLTIDMSRMRGVLVDPEAKLVRVQAGCLLGDVDRETQVHGLATVLGFVSETGVSGLTLGGGFGYLTRRFGWTVDSLVEAEIVTAEGQVLRANAETNADLFWAIRGGGGNFGVVTSFTFRLYPVGPMITGGMMVWSAERAAEVLETFDTVSQTAPRELTMAASMRLAPPAPFVPKEWHGKPIVALIVCHSGSKAQAEADLAPLRKLGNPIADLVMEKPYAAQQAMLDATQPKGLSYYWKSEFLPRLTPDVRELYRKVGTTVPSGQSQVVMFHVGGAIAEKRADDGAVGNRDAEYMLGVAGAWLPTDPDGASHMAWVRAGWESLKPHATGGVYVNFLTEEEGDDRVRAAYRDNFDRLSKVKSKYDPDNLFRSNKNVTPG